MRTWITPDGEMHDVPDGRLSAKSPDARRTIMTLTGHGGWERFEHAYLAAAALAASTAFFRPLQSHWQLYHLPQSRGPAHLEVSSVAAQDWWVRVASKWISISWSTVKGCDPGSTLGHAHPHGGATKSSASFNGRLVSLSRSHAAAIAARRACAGRVHAVR